MTATKSYLDTKIEIIVEALGFPVAGMEFLEILEDLRLSYDQARKRRQSEGIGCFRLRCKSLIIAASRAKATAKGYEREFCESLEGCILHDLLHDKETES